VSESQRKKLLILGGSGWIREQIRTAKKAGKLIPASGNEPKVSRFQARLTPEEIARFHELGGSRWLRLCLSKTDIKSKTKH
jgi:hypothetical protein